jgi:predicted nucleic acid-binding Zn ribbon protein
VSGDRWGDRRGRPGGRGRGRGRSGGGEPRPKPAPPTPPQRTAGARDEATEARRAGAQDRDVHLYERKRAQQARERAALERRSYDPAAPDPDQEWTLPDDNGSGLTRTPAPSPLGEALEQVFARRGWGERLTGATASQRWEEIVGGDLAARCEPVRLAGGTLVVRAASQVWATQLRYLVPQLVTNANQVLGEGQVREVRLVVGPLEGHGPV